MNVQVTYHSHVNTCESKLISAIVVLKMDNFSETIYLIRELYK
jgi:hypothetical protein